LFVLVVVSLLLVGLITVAGYSVFNQKPFYVGVTYCGGSVEEAKELIDKVKDYTNLFVLQSGSLHDNATAMEEIGDYAVASKMSYAVYGTVSDFGGLSTQALSSWLIEAKERWGAHFIGVYFGDEHGGKMLDRDIDFGNMAFQSDDDTIFHYFQNDTVRVMKNGYGGEIKVFTNRANVVYRLNGVIYLSIHEGYVIYYYPDGAITAYKPDWGSESISYTSENITLFPLPLPSYEELLKQNPVRTYDDAARVFVDWNKGFFDAINKEQLDKKDVSVFTADYGLYWWDYQSGYDLVLAELGWNNSIVQEIGLVRGAANLQNKQWGTIITWKYTQPPYLAGGQEMFEQMKTSYETGAQYVIIFNYSEDQLNPNILQEEHFQALERFWNEVVQNPLIVHGHIKAEAALVLPKNYGWGMRNPTDNVWGIWREDGISQEIWSQLESKIDQYGLKLDIVFEDSNYPVTGKYSNIYYWNQK